MHRSNIYRPANTNAMPDPFRWVDDFVPPAIVIATIIGFCALMLA